MQKIFESLHIKKIGRGGIVENDQRYTNEKNTWGGVSRFRATRNYFIDFHEMTFVFGKHRKYYVSEEVSYGRY